MAIRIGDLARKTGLATSALRFYEAAGLLPPARRSEAGYRLYEPGAVGRIEFVRRAQAVGLSLKEIRTLVDAPGADAAADRDRLRHLVAHKLAETEARIGELTALQRELGALYTRMARTPGPDCGHVGDCACWLPNEKEVMTMSAEIRNVKECGCDCDDPTCDVPGTCC